MAHSSGVTSFWNFMIGGLIAHARCSCSSHHSPPHPNTPRMRESPACIPFSLPMLTRAARRALRYARDELGELASPSSLARAVRLTWRFARHDLAPMLPRAARRAWRFARYDLPELAAPSSLPDPPHVVAAEAAEEAHRRALPWRGPWEHREVRASTPVPARVLTPSGRSCFGAHGATTSPPSSTAFPGNSVRRSQTRRLLGMAWR